MSLSPAPHSRCAIARRRVMRAEYSLAAIASGSRRQTLRVTDANHAHRTYSCSMRRTSCPTAPPKRRMSSANASMSCKSAPARSRQKSCGQRGVSDWESKSSPAFWSETTIHHGRRGRRRALGRRRKRASAGRCRGVLLISGSKAYAGWIARG